MQASKYFPKVNDFDTDHDYFWYHQNNDGMKLPGMGGVFNSVNLDVYHYAGNNPVRFTDPDGQFIRAAFTRFLQFGKQLANSRAGQWISRHGGSSVSNAFKQGYRAVNRAGGKFWNSILGKGWNTGKGINLFNGKFSIFKSIGTSIARRFASDPTRVNLIKRALTSDFGLKTTQTVSNQLSGARNFIPVQ